MAYRFGKRHDHPPRAKLGIPLGNFLRYTGTVATPVTYRGGGGLAAAADSIKAGLMLWPISGAR